MVMEGRGISIPVVDEVCRWEWNPEWSPEKMKEKMDWLLNFFPQKSEIPLIRGNTSHPYFKVWRAKTPFQITKESHSIYTECVYRSLHPFTGPELVFEMACSRSVQICWSELEPKGQRSIHPTEESSEWRFNAHYVVLMSPKNTTHENFLVFGTESCRKQLEMWEIDPQSNEFRELLSV